MHHETDVGLVDTHPEGHGSHHDLQIVTLEFFLHVGAHGVFQPGMIRRRADAAALQASRGVFYFRAAIAVNNAGFSPLLLHVAHQLIERFKLLHQHVADIRAVEAADLNQRVVQPQQAHNVATGSVIGGSGKRHKRQRGEALTQLAKGRVFRAEVMPPLRDTVRLIHRQHRRIPVRQMLKEVIQHQTFRGDIEQANLPGTAAGHHLLLLFAGLGGVDTGRRHAVRQQLIDLVLHQRDQR